jgi:hypothetical protein
MNLKRFSFEPGAGGLLHATINDPTIAANIARVGEVASVPLHIIPKPLPSAQGHYRSISRFVLATAQAAGSRVWEVRNPHATLLMVPTRLVVRTIQSAAGTAQENSLDLFKDTTFNAVDTTNTATPGTSLKRTTMSAANAAIRQVTATGVAAGMTGGTRTPDGSPFSQVPIVVVAAAAQLVQTFDILDDVNGTHPWIFVQNEGIEIQNRVLNVTSYGVTVFVDFSWTELAAF